MKIFMKKIISLFLALIMIAGNVAAGVSGLSEFDAKAASEYLLSVETKFYRYLEDNGTWIETRRVMPGENVRARVFVGTNYYAGPSNFMFFYNIFCYFHKFFHFFSFFSINFQNLLVFLYHFRNFHYFLKKFFIF